MVKLANILAEVNALDSLITKTASANKASKGESIASTLDKIAEGFPFEEKKEDEEDEDDEGKEEKDEETAKEGSMKDPKFIQKIAIEVAKALQKMAVADTSETQGSEVGAVQGGAQDGAATNAARKTDQIIDGASVASAADSNPNAHNKDVAGTGDLIVNAPPVPDGLQNPALGGIGASEQKVGSYVRYTAEEADALQKLASIGYDALVEYHSDRLVQEKVAAAVAEERAKDAPQKIAKQILAREKTAGVTNSEFQKLAAIKQNDPQLFSALQVLAARKLI